MQAAQIIFSGTCHRFEVRETEISQTDRSTGRFCCEHAVYLHVAIFAFSSTTRLPLSSSRTSTITSSFSFLISASLSSSACNISSLSFLLSNSSLRKVKDVEAEVVLGRGEVNEVGDCLDRAEEVNDHEEDAKHEPDNGGLAMQGEGDVVAVGGEVQV